MPIPGRSMPVELTLRCCVAVVPTKATHTSGGAMETTKPDRRPKLTTSTAREKAVVATNRGVAARMTVGSSRLQP
jgi:hypothetical protein